jgi:large subunit ribosomal protein L17
MRHLKKGRKLNRKSDHRNAMFNNMLESFFQYERIQTTAAKAKELRSLSEKMITRAKQNTLHNKRIVLKRLHNRDIVAKLFDEIAPKYQDVHGGYTRILRVGRRKGDGAQLSLIELVDVEEAAERKQKAKGATAPKKPVKTPAVRSSVEKKAVEGKPAGSKEGTLKPKVAVKTTTKTEAPKVERAEKPEPKPAKTKTATAATKSASSPKAAGKKTQAKSSASGVKGAKAKAPKPKAVKPPSAGDKQQASAVKPPSSAERQNASTPKSKPEKPDAKDKA